MASETFVDRTERRLAEAEHESLKMGAAIIGQGQVLALILACAHRASPLVAEHMLRTIARATSALHGAARDDIDRAAADAMAAVINEALVKIDALGKDDFRQAEAGEARH